MVFGKALVAREPNDRTFLPDPYNIGVEILVLFSVALISNIVLLKAEAITCEPNEKEPTFNKEPSPDNDEVKTILISDLCDFEKLLYTTGVFLEIDANICGDQLIIHRLKNHKNIQVTHVIVEGLRTTFPKLKSSINLNNKIRQQTFTG